MATLSIREATLPGRPRRLASAAAGIAVLVVAGFVVLALYAVHELQGMAVDLQRVSSQLSILESMNRKLAPLEAMSTNLTTMQSELRAMRRSLRNTNSALGETNALLMQTNAKLAVTEADIRALGSIRSDIHLMAHKISGSFLFRGVK